VKGPGPANTPATNKSSKKRPAPTATPAHHAPKRTNTRTRKSTSARAVSASTTAARGLL
jgi:hypothetical protein